MASGAPLRVTVVYSPQQREVLEWQVDVPPGATARNALQASGLGEVLDATRWNDAGIGLWGRRCALDQPLRDADRIEVYRPLQVDPKVARRERFRRQGARAAGLFARKKEGRPTPP
jgi:putative ubiquitin-RnfH superfamily antitoxin RatB of RatAB toxin-antitoxin module